MGAKACLIGFGPYAADLRDALPYQDYSEVPEGYLILVELFQCEGNQTSEDLAEAIGGDLWDFSTHRVEAEKLDFAMLEEMHLTDSASLRLLLERGFTLILQPNG